MKKTNGISKKVISLILCVAMLVVSFPLLMFKSAASDVAERVADPHTLDQWMNYFGIHSDHPQDVELSTEFAGGVWTDKSVFLPGEIPAQITGAKYEGKSISIRDKGDNFLVALSAIASNKQIKGYSTIPTDTVLILDLSSSMRSADDDRKSAVDELVAATNKAISELLSLNRNNRVAVVVYAGNTNKSFSEADGITQVVLPLGSYSANADGKYLVSVAVDRNSDYGLEVASGVKDSSGKAVAANRFETATGTYMQDGIYEAMKILLNADPVVSEGVQNGTSRMPIMVLMTDGEPTLATNDYNGNDSRTDLGKTNLSDYDGSTGEYTFRDTIAFMTSLTAAFAKKQIEAHYGTNALMYTLPYGTSVLSRSEALSVLNPEKASDVQLELWRKFLLGEEVTVFRTGSRNNYKYVNTSNSKIESEKLTADDRLYVDKYFPAKDDTEMLKAFDEIVAEIIIQSKYYPTYVENDFDHDGYITFVDKIGTYMEVSDITGIVVGDRLFSGAALASKFPANAGESIVAGNVLGDDLLNSVKDRLGINDEAVAAALVQDAYDHGQLYYKGENDYEHYIGWFSDADGNYVDFWHKGMTEEQVRETMENGATHVIRSYAFLGDTSVISGISDTDMMYMSVRVATDLTTYESIVTWRIPASLVPTVTYEVDVEVDDEGNIVELIGLELAEDSAQSPIRLLYEVELRGDIEDWNIAEKLGDEKGQAYIKENGYTFYSNKWTADASDTTANTYSHFEPSIQNERYYYTQDTVVYVKNGESSFTPYTGGNKPQGTNYYREYQVFEKFESGELRIHIHHESITEATLEYAKQDGANWYVPKDTIHRYYDYEITAKLENTTETMAYSDHPFVEKHGTAYYTYSTQGNNGRITVTPASGIKLTKNLEAGYTTDQAFTFLISGSVQGAEVIRINGEGFEESRRTIDADGKVTLKAGETVYIVGLAEGNYTVFEIIPAGADYRVASVKVGGHDSGADVATVGVESQQITAVEFVNRKQTYGSLIVSKDVTHPFDTIPDSLKSKQFTINVDLDGENVANRTFAVSGLAGISSVTTDSDGVFTVLLRDHEALTVENIPEGTRYTVTETLTAAETGFAVDASASHLSGEISATKAAYGYVVNKYTPAPADEALVVTGTKTVADETGTFDWTGKAFAFKFEQYDTATGAYTQVGEAQYVRENGGRYTFDAVRFTKLGTYYYKVSEIIPAEADRLEGMSYDATVGRVVVHVTDADVDGKLEIEVIDFATDEIISATESTVTFTKNFTNVHTTDATFVEFTVDKVVVDAHNTGIGEAGFLFGLYKVEGGVVAKDPSYTMRTVGADGKATFHIPLAKVADDTYVLREIRPEGADAIDGMIYDTAEYTVVVKAEASGGKLVGSVDFEKNGEKINEDELVFVNKMSLTHAVVELPVTKELEGDFGGEESFSFTLLETDGSFVTPKAGGVSEEITIVNRGTNKFSAIEYKKVGTYYYVVREVVGSRGGMTYDASEYHVVVDVTADGGELRADVGIRKLGAGDADEIVFTNTYTVSGSASAVISGTKILNGRPMLNGEFSFLLVQVADENGTEMNGGLVLRAENRAAESNGRAVVRFDPITYTEAGRYFYRVSEISGAEGNGITYSDAEYIVKVTVYDNNNGELESDVSVVGGVSIEFVNIYTPGKAHLEMIAFKELSGKTLTGDQFEFELIEMESDFISVKNGGENRRNTNNSYGVINFGNFSYDAEGTYYYIVREDIPAEGEEGIVYDETEYRVIVSVTDNRRGSLEATKVVYMVVKDEAVGFIPTSSVVFHNEYVITEGTAVELAGSKTLTGGELEDGMFTFELYETDESYNIDGVAPMEAVNKDGVFNFVIDYTAEDLGSKHYYLVREKNAGNVIDGITYSDAEYRIKVKIIDNGRGGVEAIVEADGLSVTAENGMAKVTGLDFVNEYEEPAPDPETDPDPTPTMPEPVHDEAQDIENPPKPPQTGDGLISWILLLLISSAGFIVTVISAIKKKKFGEN